MEGCYYISFFGQAFSWVLLIPLIVTLGTMLITMVTHESIFAIFGFYLWAPQVVIWCTQIYFQSVRPNPLCQVYSLLAFPSGEVFYTFAIIGSFFQYAWYVPSEQSWFSWVLVYLFGTLVPLIIIYVEYNRWWEVLISAGFGYLCGAAFIVVCKYFIKPKIRYLNHHFPFALFEYSSEYIKRGSHDPEILESLNKVEVYLATGSR
jgi:hypothetical protein